MKRAALIAIVTLAACSPAAPGTDVAATPAPTEAACDAAKAADLVGKPAAAQQAEAQRRSGARIVRVYESGSAVTMDYRADRLNIETDAAGTIVKLSCG